MVQQSMRDGWRQADPPERPVLFVNPKSGGGTAVRTSLADRARERGIEVTVLAADQRLAALVEEAVARGADALGMAGGDGSLAVVAAAAHAHDLPFVCIPAGTRNHFALDLGVDVNDPVAALDAFTDGVERAIDMGRVNGRLFLNNVSLGIYGEAVRQPAYRDAKVRTLLETDARGARAKRSGTRPRARGRSSDTSIAGRLSSSCRTIPMRSTARRRTARGRGSTAVDSVSSSLVRARLQLSRAGERGPRRRSRWVGRDRCTRESTARRST